VLQSIQAKLVAAISALAVMAAVIGLAGYFSMTHATSKIDTIINDRVIPMQSLKTVSDLYAINIVDTAWKTRTGQISWQEGLKYVEAANGSIHSSWKAYTGTFLTPEEKILVASAQSAMVPADRAVERLTEILRSQDQSALETFTTQEMYSVIDPVTDKVSKLTELQMRVSKEEGASAKAAAKLATLVIVIIAVATIITFIFAFNTVVRGVAQPILSMAGVMQRLADGDHQVTVPGVGRKDEVGKMAVSVLAFKESGIHRARLEAEASIFQQELDNKLKALERSFAAANHDQQQVVRAMGDELLRLADGNLTARLNDPVAPEYERLQSDFNSAVSQMQDAIRDIAASSGIIRNGTSEIAQASDDLARRTEQQAASLEQTAAALSEITSTVRQTAAGAERARDTVAKAKKDAEESSDVVQAAVTSMGQIQTSANQISQIIGVIDEIAFQTNLLALNAGVEAARAGDAGRGFAVVASEVRALAQRSADAAKEIKILISASSRQVSEGVALVGQTGQALTRIAEQVATINGVVTQIASSAQEQAAGLLQVNTAVNEMDRMTQQNAAMVEESTAAGHSLRSEADNLMTLVSRFETDGAGNPFDSRRQQRI
jgi:methyl-accepting chemotaxis protein